METIRDTTRNRTLR